MIVVVGALTDADGGRTIVLTVVVDVVTRMGLVVVGTVVVVKRGCCGAGAGAGAVRTVVDVVSGAVVGEVNGGAVVVGAVVVVVVDAVLDVVELVVDDAVVVVEEAVVVVVVVVEPLTAPLAGVSAHRADAPAAAAHSTAICRRGFRRPCCSRRKSVLTISDSSPSVVAATTVPRS